MLVVHVFQNLNTDMLSRIAERCVKYVCNTSALKAFAVTTDIAVKQLITRCIWK